jgi:hypothetical protein
VRLEPDFVLPDQFLPRGLSTPERRLLLAVLEEAVGTYQRCVAAGDLHLRAILADVDEWFASDASDLLFSFVGICDALGIEPAYVRAGLSRWAARHRTAAHHAKARYRFPFSRVNGTRCHPVARAQSSWRGA